MKLTSLIVTITIIGLGIYDLAVVVFSGTPGTISQFFVDVGFDAPAVVFAIAFTCGHWFGYMKPTPKNKDAKQT